MKVDGAFAAVRFPNKDVSKEKEAAAVAAAAGVNSEDIISLLQDCRLMRKDDLQVHFSKCNDE